MMQMDTMEKSDDEIDVLKNSEMEQLYALPGILQ
jgi:hypothetical protein